MCTNSPDQYKEKQHLYHCPQYLPNFSAMISPIQPPFRQFHTPVKIIGICKLKRKITPDPPRSAIVDFHDPPESACSQLVIIS